jgi:hypothetical protein
MRAALMVALAACATTPEARMAAMPATVVPGGVQLERDPCNHVELLMPVEIDGTLGWFVIDTGAYTNVVYAPFARRAKLELANTGERIGGGLGVPVMRIIPRTFAVPGLPEVAIPELLMLEEKSSPLARETCGVDGVISPALLATDTESVMVDYRARRMARVPNHEIDARLAAAGGRRFVAQRASNEYTPGIDVDFGEHRLRMMIDTGACCTWVTVGSAIGRAKLELSTASGKVDRLLGTTESRRVRATLQFGDVARTLDIRLLQPDENDARETGALGADVFVRCVIAILPTAMRGACL